MRGQGPGHEARRARGWRPPAGGGVRAAGRVCGGLGGGGFVFVGGGWCWPFCAGSVVRGGAEAEPAQGCTHAGPLFCLHLLARGERLEQNPSILILAEAIAGKLCLRHDEATHKVAGNGRIPDSVHGKLLS